MSEAKFTKGEWHVQNVVDNKLSIDSDSGMTLAIISNDFESDAANAHLIAAAPEMYNLLEYFLDKDVNVYSVMENIEPLLAKARSEHE